jgi:hypothetical protein
LLCVPQADALLFCFERDVASFFFCVAQALLVGCDCEYCHWWQYQTLLLICCCTRQPVPCSKYVINNKKILKSPMQW